MVSCYNHAKRDKNCIRKIDKKIFKLPHKYSKKKCKKSKCFTMRASCAPYKNCFKKQKGGNKSSYEVAYFSGGCFWGIEKKFNKNFDILDTKVGYMGGNTKNPTYETLNNKDTGHAETIQIIYDPKIVSYKSLLQLFNKIRNKNINNNKSQYRSIIFTTNEDQNKEAKLFIKKNPDIELLSKKSFPFYIAEDYHQKYNFKKSCNHLNTENINIFNLICKNNSQNAENAYTGKYLYLNGNGIYLCGCCGKKLYHSKDKYDANTGWPAFSKSYSKKNILYNPKNKELRCSGCGLHLGHRTFDGPTETKIHDCINSVCLFFKHFQQIWSA